MDTITYNNLVIDNNNKICYINEQEIILSKKEFDLLLFLMSNPNHIYSRKELLQELGNNSISLRAIDTTISRLRKKLLEYGKNIITRSGFGYGFKI